MTRLSKPILGLTFLLAALFSGRAAVGPCDLPTPPHPEPIQAVQLEAGMIYRYAFKGYLSVASSPDASGQGDFLRFQALEAGSFRMRSYNDLEGRSLASEGEHPFFPATFPSSDELRSFVCGPTQAPSGKAQLVEIEVVSGRLLLREYFAFVAHNGILYYSSHNAELLSVAEDSVTFEPEDGQIRARLPRPILGRNYCVQRSEDLVHWEDVPQTLTRSTGQEIAWAFSEPDALPYYYRIKEEK